MENYNVVMPLQAFGLGDIIYTQTLVRNIACGKKIIWGTEPQFAEGLNKAYPDITFLDKSLLSIDYNCKEDIVKNGARILPIRWADSILNVPYSECMRAKYMLYNMDFTTWAKEGKFTRSAVRENALRKKFLDGEQEYKVINRFYGSDSQYSAEIPEQGIEMKSIDGFSMFDWAGILEGAKEIHTVSTSLVFMLEMLNLKGTCVHLYPRMLTGEVNFINIIYIIQHSRIEYVLHY